MKRAPPKNGYKGKPPRRKPNPPGQPRRSLSPWTVLTVMYRARCGEPIKHLGREYNLAATTIHRWIDKWAHEVDFAVTALTVKDLDAAADVVGHLFKEALLAEEKLAGLQARLRREYGRYREHRKAAICLPGSPLPKTYWPGASEED